MAWELASAQLEAKQKLWASGSVDCALKPRRQKTVGAMQSKPALRVT